MALEHATLSGAQLHEPKGIETASSGEVYVADGAGTGSWVDPLNSIHNANLFPMQTQMADVAAVESVYFNNPTKSQIVRLTVIPYGVIDADTVLSIYIGGVLFGESLTLVAAGSGAGIKQTLTTTTAHSIADGTTIAVTSDGAATASVKAEIQLEMQAVA